MENKDSFRYTYSAAQRQEVEHIRSKYAPREEDKLEQLRRLHRSAGQTAQAWAISQGSIGALILGTGMSLLMSDLPTLLGMGHKAAVIVGMVLGLLGMVLVALAYPLYDRILKKERQRIAPEILRLSDELLK